MKLDLHVHTRCSKDSLVTPEGAVRKAGKKGLDGIAITDHNSGKGWRKAREEARKQELHVVRGEEVLTSKGELMGLFLTEPIENKGIDPMEAVDRIKSQGGILVIPHPFDSLRMPYQEPERIVKKLDAVEVFNAKILKEKFNQRALEFARKYKLARTGGSDSHSSFTIGAAYTEAEASDLEGFRKAILDRKTTVTGKRVNFVWRMCPKVAKLKKILGLGE